MNGAESLIKTLVASGVEVCFTNPGTSEMHFVAALDEVDGMRCVLGLFEGVVSGAADGYARLAGKPAATLLHLGPGLGNALANIHNAKKANVPMVNIVGDHATYHLEYDAPLTADIEGIAAPLSHWVHSATTADTIASDGADAVAAAGHSRIATLILPADVSWGDNPAGEAAAADVPPRPTVDSEAIQAAAAALQSSGPAMILVGGTIDREATTLLSQVGESCGARVCVETFPTRLSRGPGSGEIEKLPYLAEQAIEFLADIETLVLIGAQAPVSFFAYPGVASVLQSDACNVVTLASAEHDLNDCLQQLLANVDNPAPPRLYQRSTIEPPTGDLNAFTAAQAIAAHLPDDAIIVDEGATSSIACFDVTGTAAPHDWLGLTGGSIGFGLPCAAGAAIACPDRKVLCLEGDGSAMYTIQSLWTMAREDLDVTVILFNNAKYNILELEFARTGARGGKPGPKAATMLDIGSPTMDFVSMANSMGVHATRAETAEAFSEQLANAMQQRGPVLIEAIVPAFSL